MKPTVPPSLRYTFSVEHIKSVFFLLPEYEVNSSFSISLLLYGVSHFASNAMAFMSIITASLSAFSIIFGIMPSVFFLTHELMLLTVFLLDSGAEKICAE